MITASKGCKLFLDGVQGIFNEFVRSGLFTNVVHEKVGEKEHIRLYVPNELSENLGKYTTTPRIYKPDVVYENILIEYMIPTDYATIDIAPSASFIKSVNISNGKRFSINVNFLNILTSIENGRHYPINNPIPTEHELNEISCKRDTYDCRFNKFGSHVIDLIQTELSKRNIVLEHAYQYRYAVNQTKAESRSITEKDRYSELYRNMSVERKGGLTRLILASVLSNFPLYYTNTLCSTTRAFAKEYIISRHIGCLKLLRGEYTGKQVSTIGIIYMLDAYYSDDRHLAIEFRKYLDSKGKCGKKDLREFFDNNRICYANKEAVTHFMLLAVELNKIFRSVEPYRTKLLLQYDQVASGLVFIALLWKNVELGKRTNLIASEDGNLGPYDLAKDKFEGFYVSNVQNKNRKVLEFVKSSKKLHKYALMCYAYNQTIYGRTNDFVDFWFKEFNMRPIKEECECLQEIYSKYTDFINELFPGMDSQFKILDDIVRLVVSNSGCLKIRTIDGAVVTWKFYKKDRYIRKSFNPHTMTPESYALYSGVVDNEGRPVVDETQFILKFRSYLIHSVDAGVMRLIIKDMFKLHRYRVDQLHDCVLLHPNYVDAFYQVVENIYKSKSLSDYMNSHVFSEFKSLISSDKFELFDKLVSDFTVNQDSTFNISGDFRMVYKPEV